MLGDAVREFPPVSRHHRFLDATIGRMKMREQFVSIVNELCDVFHGLGVGRRSDISVINFSFSLIGIAPIGEIPISIGCSLNCFRPLTHQERYTFIMTEMSNLMDEPSANTRLSLVFAKVLSLSDPVCDMVGHPVIENGCINFGTYQNASVTHLIFQIGNGC